MMDIVELEKLQIQKITNIMKKRKKVQNKKIVTKYHKFLANKHRKECVKVVGVLINRYKKSNKKISRNSYEK